ncbi:DMT family transporter [bacterium]|nr:DMT family transporter [bacterium]
MTKSSSSIWIHIALFSVSALYAGNFTFAKWAMPEFIGPFGFILLRVAAGAVLFGLYFFLFGFEKIRERKHYVQLAVAGFFGVALNMLAFFKGLSLTSPINASVLMLFAPVFVVIFMAFDQKYRLRRNVIIGMLMAFTGAAFLMGLKNFSLSGPGIAGDLLVILNACSYGFYLYYVGRLLEIYKTTTIVAYIFIFGLLFVIPVGYSELMVVEWSAFPPKAVFAAFYAVIGITFIAYFLNSWAIQKSSGALVAAYVYLQPVLATIIAILFGEGSLSLEKTIFAALIIGGVYLVNKAK